MAAAHSRAYRQRSKLNSEVLTHQQAGAAERMRRMRAKQKEILASQITLNTSAFSMVQTQMKINKEIFKSILRNSD